MIFSLLLLPFLASAISTLPPEPLQHLTPPQLSSQHEDQSSADSLPEKFIKWLRNDSSKATDDPKPPKNEQKLESQHQETRSIVWAAPAIPIISSHRGRSSDNCNPCERVPWVPMARALNTQQYALSIPTIQLTLPVNYGIPVAQMRPAPQYGPPPQQHGPPQIQYGSPPQQQYGPPSQHGSSTAQQGPPPQQHGLSPQQYGPPPQQHGPSTTQQGLPPQQHGPQPQQYGPPTQQYGPPRQQHGPSVEQHGPPPQQYGPPLEQYGPPSQQHRPPTAQRDSLPQQYGPPQQHGPPSSQYEPPSAPPASDDAKDNTHKLNQYGPPEDGHPGLPPPPLPQRFISPLKTYGPPQPQTQYASSTNLKPTAHKYLPPPAHPLPNYQVLSSVKYGPPFDVKLSSSKAPSNYLPAKAPPLHGARPVNHGPQQLQEGSAKKPVFVQNPIPFPTMSKTQLPPLFNYQTFNDGKHIQIHPYLQPPKPQNVVFTITETDDICKMCQEKNQATDSEPAQAEHVTENVVKTTNKHNENPLEHQKHSVQVVKSVPLAEYLASVEYPMQIIQAPILDVPDLTKYFDLGYHNLPEVTYQQGNNYKPEDQKSSQSLFHPIQQSAVYVNHNVQKSNGTSFEYTSTTALDNVDVTDGHTQTTNSLPPNHKPNIDVLGKNHDVTEKGFTSSPFSHTTTFHTTPTTRPSQIFHISKVRPSSNSNPTSQTTENVPTSQAYSTTTGQYVTTQPVTDGKTELRPPNVGNPAPFHQPVHSSSLDHPGSETAEGSNPSGSLNLRFQDPPPLGSGAISDWTLHSFGRGWGNTPPQPFVMPTATPSRARFEVRPSPAPAKKAKHIHQIIVPYTTNKHTSQVAQEPANNLGWTPIPPTNQGRKVPTNLNFGDQYPSTTGLEQVHQYQNIFPTDNSPVSSNLPLRAFGSDTLGSQEILSANNGKPLNLPPQVINQILHLNQQGTPWPTGPEGLQQLLVTNLQGLLRGEEDSIDIARLQKNIDNWTAEGYKQNSPSVNFIPVTTIPHIFNSKKIPDEYLTSTEPTATSNSSHQDFYESYQHNGDSDHEGAESQKHHVKVHPYAHSKDQGESADTTDSIETLLNGWSLLETKIMTTPTTSTEAFTTTEAEPTSKAWEKIQVSISPLTHEKVYVVTPVPVTEPLSESNEGHTSSLLSTRVERSYSIVTSNRAAKVLEPPSPQSDQSRQASQAETTV